MKFLARWTHSELLLMLCISAFCGSLAAQTEKTITIRMLDDRTGHRVEASTFLVRIDHQTALHGEWIHQNEDGTVEMKLPSAVSVFSIQATYETSTQVFVNCDSAEEKGNPVDRWYKVSDILASGVISPNTCVKPKEAAKLQTTVKPGEFVFYVRKRNLREKISDYSE